MKNYFWKQPQREVDYIEEITDSDEIKSDGIEWLNRFPEDAHGWREWREYWDNYIYEENRVPFSYSWLFDPNLEDYPIKAPKRPRVFISHRQSDVAEAVRIANLANIKGFNYWLDVFDPNLQALNKLLLQGSSSLSKAQKCFAIASIIEMGLINCSHVLVVYTPNTKGSNWVPYEYGRVKDSPIITMQAASWVLRSKNVKIPEYMYLGKIIRHKHDANDHNNPYHYLEEWFKDEMNDWKRRNS